MESRTFTCVEHLNNFLNKRIREGYKNFFVKCGEMFIEVEQSSVINAMAFDNGQKWFLGYETGDDALIILDTRNKNRKEYDTIY